MMCLPHPLVTRTQVSLARCPCLRGLKNAMPRLQRWYSMDTGQAFGLQRCDKLRTRDKLNSIRNLKPITPCFLSCLKNSILTYQFSAIFMVSSGDFPSMKPFLFKRTGKSTLLTVEWDDEIEQFGVTANPVPGLCGDECKIARAVRSGDDSHRTVRNSAMTGPPWIKSSPREWHLVKHIN